MNRLWRIAGALCIAHVVLLLAGYSQQRSPVFGASPSAIVTTYGGVPTAKMYVGGYIVTVAWLVLLAAVTLVARLVRLVRGTGEVSGWFASLSVAVGALATAVTLGGAYAAAGAAFYGARHGFAANVVASVNYVSKFSDFIAIAALGACAIAVGGAALASAALPRWAAWLSVLVGVFCVASASGTAMLDAGTLLFLAWLIVLAVVLLRGPARARQAALRDRVLAAELP
jgi:hypothetical protein